MSVECNIVDYVSVSYKEFMALQKRIDELEEVYKVLSEAVIKAMDLNLLLQKKVKDLNEDIFLNAQHINLLKQGELHKQPKNNDIQSLWEYVEKMANHIKELERNKKGFIRRFFDKFRLIKHDDLDIKKHKSKQKFTLNDD